MTAFVPETIRERGENARFEIFETSAAILQRAGWRLLNPQIRRIADEEECHAFIRSPLPTDKRINMIECRLRVLCVYLDHRDQVTSYKSLLKIAEDSAWIYNGFTSLVAKGTTGSTTCSGAVGKISLFLQTPRDSMPFLAFSLTEVPAEARKQGSDWVCLVFLTAEIELKALLHESSFPTDYSPLSPDFMHLPVRILEDQVELVRDGLRGPAEALVQEEESILQMRMKLDDFGRARRVLFDVEKRVRELRDRWRFAQELGDSLMRCFGELVVVSVTCPTAVAGRAGKTGQVSYSKTLLNRVETQIAIAGMLRIEFDSISSAIKEQHRKIEAELNLIIAHNSYVSAEEARRDGSSMKTIAAITLIFLPATTVASIFSMSMFNWSGEDDQPVITHRFWVYIIAAIGLTVIVVALWLLWFTRSQRENNTRDLPLRYIGPALSGAREPV
ncbi:hypothetical protein IFM58399_10193 [Aspergillus lentulus]|uniref:uncharacterized protein n=1 Tax=Aspergillus lentulus TaxID=293939 RepID=UPI0013959873|nr:uncharacterized protein IFM58399_10193 [Aspergillus lentulus]GFF55919.1 hypothetical protein IFM58399_10193 [Aspergillus lentulus]